MQSPLRRKAEVLHPHTYNTEEYECMARFHMEPHKQHWEERAVLPCSARTFHKISDLIFTFFLGGQNLLLAIDSDVLPDSHVSDTLCHNAAKLLLA